MISDINVNIAASYCLLIHGDNPHVVFPDTEVLLEKHANDDLFLTFGGSDSLADWKYNLRAMQSIDDGYFSYAKGFLELFAFVKQYLDSEIIPTINDHKTDRSTLFISGHSQGGAIAKHVALYLREKIKCNIEVITFGVPNIANEEWEEFFSKCFPTAKTYRNRLDVLTYLPFCFSKPKNITYFTKWAFDPHNMETYVSFIQQTV